MSTNPFTGNSVKPEDPKRWKSGNNNKKSIIIFALLLIILPLLYFLKNNGMLGKIASSVDAMTHERTSEAYLLGDPWNGRIVYNDYFPSGNTTKNIFSIYDTKTKERKVFATYRNGTDPFYHFIFIGENDVLLSDRDKYAVSYNFTITLQPQEEKFKISHISDKRLYLNSNDNFFEDTVLVQYTDAVLPKNNTRTHAETETVFEKYTDEYNGYNNDWKTKVDIKPKKNYLQCNMWGNIEVGMGIKSDREKGIEGPELRDMGVTDFNGYNLKYSHWVYDYYSMQPINDSTSSAYLILVVLENGSSSHNEKSFFALIDKQRMKMKLTGYPNNTINASFNDYFMNCRREDKDHILCLTRDKVLRVQISTCKIEKVASW